MSVTRDFYRLTQAIEDLAEGFYEANRLRAKEHREILDRLAELTSPKEQHDVNVSLKSSALLKFLPWIIAALSGGMEAVHRLSGG